MGENVETPDLQGCSRQTVPSVISDMMERNIREQATLLALKQWLQFNPPPREVEEYLWNLLVFKQR